MEKTIAEHQDLLSVTIYQENGDADIVIVEPQHLMALIWALQEAAKEIGV